MVDARVRAWSQEMQQVHQRLRDALALARESVGDQPSGPLPSQPLTSDLLLYCWGFCAALGGHHRGEDAALFPLVTAAHPELAAVISQLSQDHSMINHLIGAWQHDLEGGAGAPELLRHLEGIEAVMETHFRYEERRLLSVLDDLDLDGLSRNDLFGAIA